MMGLGSKDLRKTFIELENGKLINVEHITGITDRGDFCRIYMTNKAAMEIELSFQEVRELFKNLGVIV